MATIEELLETISNAEKTAGILNRNTNYAEGFCAACRMVRREIAKLKRENGREATVKGKNKTKVYTFTDESLAQLTAELTEKIEKRTMPNAIYVANALYSSALLLTLHDDLGFGEKRLYSIFEHIQHTFNCLMTGEVNYYDLCTTLREECGVNLVIERPEGVTIKAEDIYKAASGIKPYRVYMRK